MRGDKLDRGCGRADVHRARRPSAAVEQRGVSRLLHGRWLSGSAAHGHALVLVAMPAGRSATGERLRGLQRATTGTLEG